MKVFCRRKETTNFALIHTFHSASRLCTVAVYYHHISFFLNSHLSKCINTYIDTHIYSLYHYLSLLPSHDLQIVTFFFQTNTKSKINFNCNKMKEKIEKNNNNREFDLKSWYG